VHLLCACITTFSHCFFRLSKLLGACQTSGRRYEFASKPESTNFTWLHTSLIIKKIHVVIGSFGNITTLATRLSSKAIFQFSGHSDAFPVNVQQICSIPGSTDTDHNTYLQGCPPYSTSLTPVNTDLATHGSQLAHKSGINRPSRVLYRLL
jgi:hypothetical protein